ncbi:MAG TPA: hypothetical protein VGM91_19075 [Conexibacter sp.]|jgi:hypothetical protein
MTPQPLASRRVSRHVELADGLDLYVYTCVDGITVVELDIVVGGAVEHSDVGVPRLRIYVNDDVVHDQGRSDDGRDR